MFDFGFDRVWQQQGECIRLLVEPQNFIHCGVLERVRQENCSRNGDRAPASLGVLLGVLPTTVSQYLLTGQSQTAAVFALPTDRSFLRFALRHVVAPLSRNTENIDRGPALDSMGETGTTRPNECSAVMRWLATKPQQFGVPMPITQLSLSPNYLATELSVAELSRSRPAKDPGVLAGFGIVLREPQGFSKIQAKRWLQLANLVLLVQDIVKGYATQREEQY